MDSETVASSQKKKISELLKEDGRSTIILIGDPGLWKTWLEREISKNAVIALWINKAEKYSSNLLEEAIRRQALFESSNIEEWEEQEEEEDEDGKKTEGEMATHQEENKEDKKIYHLVLDGEGINEMDENELVKEASSDFKNLLHSVQPLLPSVQPDHLKIIMTRRKTEQSGKVINFPSMSTEESLNLLKNEFPDNQVSKKLFEVIAEKGKRSPAAITMIAKALKKVVQRDSGDPASEIAMEQAAYYKKPDRGVNELISCAYDMLPSDVLKNCFQHSIQFFRKYRSIHYNVLITHWIMEGYFEKDKEVFRLEKAYHEAHGALMDLIDRGILKAQDVNIVVMEGAALNMIDSRHKGCGGMDRLRLASVFEKDGGTVLRRISPLDGTIRTVCNPKKLQEVLTLLIDGSRLCREDHRTFFNLMPELQVLAIFKPRFKSLMSSSFEMEKLLKRLTVLVLRNCDTLEDITGIKELKTLAVLEISGASSLKSNPDELFDGMTQLQSLNLSGCLMKSLPSLPKLTKLRFLILRQCSCLEYMPSLKKLHDLEIIDLSGATSLSSFQQLDFSSHTNLQMVDLSYTQIPWLPKFTDLKHLSRILLRGCRKLLILPSFQKLRSLKILDLSEVGFSNFTEIKLKDPSTQQLPFLPCSLSELYLRKCSALEHLPPTTALKNLELLDLSNTNLKQLPSELRNLRKLLLNNCLSLTKLPEMKGLEKLEELRLSGCINLTELPNLNDFPKLELLDISNTGIREIPDEILELSRPKIIREVDEETNQAEDVNRGRGGMFMTAEIQAST